jgi:hypothetical protein
VKETVTQVLNPKWVDPAVVTEGSSVAQPVLMAAPQWIPHSTFASIDLVDTYSPGLDKARGATSIPYAILNNQCINMFARLLDRSLHHLLAYNRAINPNGASAAVFAAIKAHFSCSVWMDKDDLTRAWEDIRVCTDPEVTYNRLLALNQECKEAGVGHSDFQVASKFVHLLQTADDRAYMHLLTELARKGESAEIRQIWFIAQITWKQLKANQARSPPPTHHLGMSASYQQGQGQNSQGKFGPCLWCDGQHHTIERCYAKDTANIKKYPSKQWLNGVPPQGVLKKYYKNFSQAEARGLMKILAQARAKCAPTVHQANVAWTPSPSWTPPDIYSAVPAATSTCVTAPPQPPAAPTLDLYTLARERSRYDFVEPEDLAIPQQAMPARTEDGGDKLELRLLLRLLLHTGPAEPASKLRVVKDYEYSIMFHVFMFS